MTDTNVFEIDDATEKIIDKAVRDRDLDRSTEATHDRAKETMKGDFNQYNYETKIGQRNEVVNSIQMNLGPLLDTIQKWDGEIEDRENSDEFQRDKQDNAIDVDDYEMLKDQLKRLRKAHSKTAIWAYLAHANSQDIAKAIDVQQMQANQNKAMEMVNKNFEGLENMLQGMGRELGDAVERGMKNAVEDTREELERKTDRIDELEREIEELESEEFELPSAKQLELMKLVRENPDWDKDDLADNSPWPKNKIGQMESRIRDKGFPFSIE